MDITIPDQPVKITLAGIELCFCRDKSESGFILVESPTGKEALSMSQYQTLIQGLSGILQVTVNAIKADSLKQ